MPITMVVIVKLENGDRYCRPGIFSPWTANNVSTSAHWCLWPVADVFVYRLCARLCENIPLFSRDEDRKRSRKDVIGKMYSRKSRFFFLSFFHLCFRETASSALTLVNIGVLLFFFFFFELVLYTNTMSIFDSHFCRAFKNEIRGGRREGKKEEIESIFSIFQSRTPHFLATLTERFPRPWSNVSFPRWNVALQKRLFMTRDPTPWNTITLRFPNEASQNSGEDQAGSDTFDVVKLRIHRNFYLHFHAWLPFTE